MTDRYYTSNRVQVSKKVLRRRRIVTLVLAVGIGLTWWKVDNESDRVDVSSKPIEQALEVRDFNKVLNLIKLAKDNEREIINKGNKTIIQKLDALNARLNLFIWNRKWDEKQLKREIEIYKNYTA